MVKITIVVVILVIACACSSNKVKLTNFQDLRYGEKKEKIVAKFESEGAPVFKYFAGEDEFFAEIYVVKGTHQSYLYLYQNHSLISVITLEEARNSWNEKVGPLKLPYAHELEVVAKSIINNRINLKLYDFSVVNKENKIAHNTAIVEGVAANLAMPAGLYALIATAPITIPTALGLQGDYNMQTNSFIVNLNSLDSNADKKAITDKIGDYIYSKRISSERKEEVFVFHRGAKFSVGLINGKLRWIGYYYDAVKGRSEWK